MLHACHVSPPSRHSQSGLLPHPFLPPGGGGKRPRNSAGSSGHLRSAQQRCRRHQAHLCCLSPLSTALDLAGGSMAVQGLWLSPQLAQVSSPGGAPGVYSVAEAAGFPCMCGNRESKGECLALLALVLAHCAASGLVPDLPALWPIPLCASLCVVRLLPAALAAWGAPCMCSVVLPFPTRRQAS